jgi:predicted DNA-binding transcriptional regulator AlpA
MALPMSRNRVSFLPPSLPPRGLSRVQAAEYIGIGVSKFDELVADGRMPKPKRIDSRTVWDREQLDDAFAALDNENTADRGGWENLHR